MCQTVGVSFIIFVLFQLFMEGEHSNKGVIEIESPREAAPNANEREELVSKPGAKSQVWD